jgi:drug/metabolite transporter (DMT)-like permease
MVAAIRHAPLSTLTPFSYAQVAFAAVISWALFRHAPDHWAAAGMGMIATAGVGTVWLNGRVSSAAANPTR